MKKENWFSVQLKPVGSDCNIRCRYCYVEPFRTQRKILMPQSILKRIIGDCVKNSPVPTFSWHGGEPTMSGLDYLGQAISFMESANTEGKNIRNQIQTNATLITPAMAKFFAQKNFIVGVSLDGTEEAHGENRIDSRGKNTFRKTISGIEILRSEGISPSVICTVTKETLLHAEEVFTSLVQNGFKEIKYSPVFNPDENTFGISSEEWYQYLLRVFKSWFDLSNSEIKVRELDEVISWLVDEPISVCSSNNTCLRWVSINPNGNLYPCEYFSSDLPYGNIREISLADIPQTSQYQRFEKLFTEPPKRCKGCGFYHLCGNGCPATRMSNGKISTTGTYAFCDERRGLYATIRDTFNQCLSDSEGGV